LSYVGGYCSRFKRGNYTKGFPRLQGYGHRNFTTQGCCSTRQNYQPEPRPFDGRQAEIVARAEAESIRIPPGRQAWHVIIRTINPLENSMAKIEVVYCAV